MIQRLRCRCWPSNAASVWVLICLLASGCEGRGEGASPSDKPGNPSRGESAAAAHPTAARPTAAPRIVSLVPSVTDLVLTMGLGEHLVAVSNYCHAHPDARDLPTAGDYQTTDWERLSALRPDVLIVFSSPERLPSGMAARAASLGIRLESMGTETIADVRSAMRRLGELTGRVELAEQCVRRLDAGLEAVRRRVAGRAPVPALIALGESARAAAGVGGFLDELLTLAGGRNVASQLATAYPQLDREQRVALAPSVILHLLPGATPAQAAAAQRFWASQPEGREGSPTRVVVLTAWYLLQPGGHLVETAEAFADALHGRSPDAPSSRPEVDR